MKVNDLTDKCLKISIKKLKGQNFFWGCAPEPVHSIAIFLALTLMWCLWYFSHRLPQACIWPLYLQLNIFIKKPGSPLIFIETFDICLKVLRLFNCGVKNFCWGLAPDPISITIPLVTYDCFNILWKSALKCLILP